MNIHTGFEGMDTQAAQAVVNACVDGKDPSGKPCTSAN
jgi:hypothetical protein